MKSPITIPWANTATFSPFASTSQPQFNTWNTDHLNNNIIMAHCLFIGIEVYWRCLTESMKVWACGGWPTVYKPPQVVSKPSQLPSGNDGRDTTTTAAAPRFQPNISHAFHGPLHQWGWWHDYVVTHAFWHSSYCVATHFTVVCRHSNKNDVIILLQ